MALDPETVVLGGFMPLPVIEELASRLEPLHLSVSSTSARASCAGRCRTAQPESATAPQKGIGNFMIGQRQHQPTAAAVELWVGLRKDRQAAAPARSVLSRRAPTRTCAADASAVELTERCNGSSRLASSSITGSGHEAAEHDGLGVERHFQHVDCLAQRVDRLGEPGFETAVAVRQKFFQHVGRGMVWVRQVELVIGRAQRDIAFQAAALATIAGQAAGPDDDVADLAGIVAAALVEVAIEKEAGAKTRSDEQINEAVEFARNAVEPLGLLPRRSRLFDRDGDPGQPLQFLGHGKIVPAGERGRADRSHALDTERAGHRHADAEQPVWSRREVAIRSPQIVASNGMASAGVGRSTLFSTRARMVPERSVTTPTASW